jgi:DNA-binding transcriptional ArsR family regulator
MSRGADLARVAPVFTALGDPVRLALVSRLSSEGPLSIAELTGTTRVTRQAVSKHLDVLAGAGLVRDLKVGRERIWELDPRGLDQTRKYLDQISKRWDEALDRLKRFVED